MARQRRNVRSQVELAKEYLLARNGHCSNEECAATVPCSVRTVIRARRELQRQNPLFPPAPGDRASNNTVLLSTTGVEEIERTLAEVRGDSGDPLTDTEKLRMLATLTRRAYREDNAKLAGDLMTVHTRIKEGARDKPHLGPRAPISPAEKIDRTWAILDCVGPDIAASAIHRAFEGTDLTDFCTTLDRLKATAPQHSSSIEGESSASAAVTPFLQDGDDLS